MEEANQKQDKMTIEEAKEKLEAVLTELEGGECAREQSFALYKKGMSRGRYMEQCVDRIEKQIIQIEESGEWDEL